MLTLIAAGGAVLAAIIAGFGAATLKHRWDVQDVKWRWGLGQRAQRQPWPHHAAAH